MNDCSQTCCDMRMPAAQPMPVPMAAPAFAGCPCGQIQGGQIQGGPGPVLGNASMPFMPDRFPIGMGYVPMQKWEQTYPICQGFQRGTIFPALDYPFLMGRCRR